MRPERGRRVVTAEVEAAVKVLHRDEHLLVLEKPSGIATTGTGEGKVLVDVARALDRDAPRLHPSSRLDAEVSGIVTFARTPEATQHLLEARRAGQYARGYLGIASGVPEVSEGKWEDAIGIDPRDARKRVVVAGNAPGARTACSHYRVLAEIDGGKACALWLEPQTGRTHQLRVHAAHAGVALYGDRPYGGPQRLVLTDGSVVTARRAMLHCCRVTIPALDGGEPLQLRSQPSDDLCAFWRAAGGRSPLPLPE